MLEFGLVKSKSSIVIRAVFLELNLGFFREEVKKLIVCQSKYVELGFQLTLINVINK